MFFNAVGMGLDAAVALASERFKRLPGKAAYLGAVPQVLRRWTSPHVRVTLDPEGTSPQILYEGPLFLMTVANGTSSGGGFRLTPEASLTDGLLDVCLVQCMSVRRVVQLLPRALRGTHTHAPEVRMRTITSLLLESEAPLPVHADGEVITRNMRRLEIRTAPAGLSVLTPA
jgi:diacylglycerol kinase (ATP)